MLADRVFAPASPTNFNPGKLTSPEARFLTEVPEIVAPEMLKVI
jgi:hypothetical protein